MCSPTSTAVMKSLLPCQAPAMQNREASARRSRDRQNRRLCQHACVFNLSTSLAQPYLVESWLLLQLSHIGIVLGSSQALMCLAVLKFEGYGSRQIRAPCFFGVVQGVPLKPGHILHSPRQLPKGTGVYALAARPHGQVIRACSVMLAHQYFRLVSKASREHAFKPEE